MFTDVTDSAGITFVHRELPGRMMPIGAGVVVLDFDGDKRDDIYFLNTNGPNHLYRNTAVMVGLRKWRQRPVSTTPKERATVGARPTTTTTATSTSS